MQKIVLESLPEYNVKTFINMGKYLVGLSAITFVCFLFTSPLFVFQALLSWVIIYNFSLAFFGTPPKIDNIYFTEPKKGTFYYYPLLDGSETKYSFLMPTEIFVYFVSAGIYDTVIRESNEFLSLNNLFTLLLTIYLWRKLILLLRGIYCYGRQSLENLSPRDYVPYEQYRIPHKAYFFFLFFVAFYLAHSYMAPHNRIEFVFSPYTLSLLIFITCSYCKTTDGIITIITITALAALQFHLAGISYSLHLLLLLLAILFIYLIMLLAKDVLLRESYILFNEGSCDALKQDVKDCIRSFVKETRRIVYLAMSLYLIFVIFLFAMIFRLEFARQLAPIFGLDYF